MTAHLFVLAVLLQRTAATGGLSCPPVSVLRFAPQKDYFEKGKAKMCFVLSRVLHIQVLCKMAM